MRFNTPDEVLAWADATAKGDMERHLKNNIDLNPFCTDGARNDWQRGFDNKGPRSYDLPSLCEFDTVYQRGRAVARLIEQMIAKANEIRYEIVKDTASDYYMFKAKFWVEDSPATFDTPHAAAQAVIDLHEERDL